MADYVTTAELKRLLPDKGTEDDTYLGEVITRASGEIDRLCGQPFSNLGSQTKVFDGTNSRILMLPRAWPLISVSSLQVKPGGEGDVFQTVPTADYFLEPAGRLTGDPARSIELAVWNTGPVAFFPWGKGVVSIAGSWGWAATPNEIKEVCLEMAVRAYRTRGGRAGGGVSMGPDDVDDLTRNLTPRAVAILRRHGYQQMMVA
jgi:hypothetical protein